MTPPTLDEVTTFVSAKGMTFAPQDFIDHYAARNWRYGGKNGDEHPLKSWRIACYQWQRRELAGERRRHTRALVGSHAAVVCSISTGPTTLSLPLSMPPDIRDIEYRASNRGELLDGELERLIAWKKENR